MQKQLTILIAILLVCSFFAPSLDVFNTTKTAEANGVVVGVYDIAVEGIPIIDVSSALVAAGATVVEVETPDAATLAGLDIFVVFNSNNDPWTQEWIDNLAAIDAAVANGLILVIHDRYVDSVAGLIPGAAGATITRDFANDADVDVVATNTVTNGPAGIIDDTTLDGGSSSTHGYVDMNTVPASAFAILSIGGNPSQGVLVQWAYGAGRVLYSSIPLDYYLEGRGNIAAFTTIYYPNLIAYLLGVAATLDGIVVSVPNIGAFLISVNDPQPVYDSPNGENVKINGMGLWLPADADGNGFDTYVVTESRVVDGVQWLAFFLGSAEYGWIQAVNVVPISIPAAD